jgi:hypothetical protein
MAACGQLGRPGEKMPKRMTPPAAMADVLGLTAATSASAGEN